MSKTEELVQACFSGRLDLVQSLVEEGVDINAMGRIWNPLHAAIENEQVGVINYLLASGADVEYACGGMRPLHHAIDLEIDAATQTDEQEGAEAIMTKLLIDAGADINERDNDGRTPLRMAIERGHKKAERLLRSRGAD
jgi:ankyrin repeat protein